MVAQLVRFCCFLILFSSLKLNAQSLANSLEEIAEDENLMGMSVVTICEGEIDLVYHYGIKDYTRQLTIDDSTLFRIASISKMITATGAMLLVDQGLLDLDEDISTYLGFTCRNPLYPDSPITTRMLLSHTSSIQDGSGYNGFLSTTYSSILDLPPLEILLSPSGDFFTSNMWRTETPGTWFTYSNLNFGVLATVMESVSGQRFDHFMKESLFEPMGLSCSFNVAHIENIDNLAVIYRNQGGWTAQVDNYQGDAPNDASLPGYFPGGNGLRFAPQGGLRCSTPDLARLLLLHLNEGYDNYTDQQLISQEQMQLMHTPEWSYNGSNGDNYFNLFNEWGLGIQQTTNTDMGDIVLPGTTFLGHPGEAYGLISDLYFNKASQNGIIFLTNGAWEGFSFGNNSAFYTLEEAVFQAWGAHQECTVSIDETRGLSFEYYPNPIQSGSVLRWEGNKQKMQLLDSCGRFVSGMDAPANQMSIEGVAPGLYFLKEEERPELHRIIVR